MPIKLRPDQEAVAAYRSGYMAVPAVPGAGKTTVLAYLAADLIATGLADPGRILIVTYTNSAVGNFRARIADFLDERGFPRGQGYEVRTIHSLAMNIVRERPEALLWTENFTILDEVRQSGLLDTLTHNWIGRHRPVWEAMIKQDLKGNFREKGEQAWAERTRDLCRNLIQSFKAHKVTPSQAVEMTTGLPETSFLRWGAEVYVEYQRALDRMGAVDFGDLVLGAYRLVSEDAELLQRLRQRWTYIFEDEAQDSYRLQAELLQQLAGPTGNLVRVGDANQAIMGTFTAAEPALFRRFCNDPDVTVRPLTMAGRSSQDIIDLANELVRWTRDEHPEPGCRTALEHQRIQAVPADSPEGNPQPDRYTIYCRAYDDYDQDLDNLAKVAASFITRNPDRTAAVLLPTRAMQQPVLARLAELEVKAHQLGGPTSPERLRTAEDLLTVLDFLAAPHQPERLLNAICRLLGITRPADAPFAGYIRECRPEELFYPLDGSTPFADLYEAVPEARGWIELGGALEQLRRWLPDSHQPADELVVRLAHDLGLREEQEAIAYHIALRARLFLLQNPAFSLPEIGAELHAAIADVGKFADLLYDRKGFKPLPGVVYVSTCHSAKGLEWDTVCAGAITREEYPSDMTDKVRSEHWFLAQEIINPEALAQAELARLLGDDPGADPVARAKLEIIGERLRLLYVAITRARTNLMLSAHHQTQWKKRTRPAAAFEHLRRFAEGRAKGDAAT